MYNAKAYSAAMPIAATSHTSRGAIQPNKMYDRNPVLRYLPFRSSLECAMNGAVMPTVYPIVPGMNEIVGRVTKVGSAVTKFKARRFAAVGCLSIGPHVSRVSGWFEQSAQKPAAHV